MMFTKAWLRNFFNEVHEICKGGLSRALRTWYGLGEFKFYAVYQRGIR